ncbi:hypothetical protein D1007_39594 [Hordeum vulgare]|nr:hypothetical protein D1007_39594 [Hordeum vulgare]
MAGSASIAQPPPPLRWLASSRLLPLWFGSHCHVLASPGLFSARLQHTSAAAAKSPPHARRAVASCLAPAGPSQTLLSRAIASSTTRLPHRRVFLPVAALFQIGLVPPARFTRGSPCLGSWQATHRPAGAPS